MRQNYSEADTRANFIDPKLAAQRWEPVHIIREYYVTDGRKLKLSFLFGLISDYKQK